ncbi:uncharacterized protein BDZ99DRAFT_259398 [Mytilinidion resinicola]|uniref:Uncharacterized protein n=1 Tax=Mytilinidion resinicola TaxID=574789 RepID=A0A6A6YXS3_9PEZI|nr:uncharacterized protein BDZ99DRAFT_259398 [Mytilinidion resinicola]KAF2813580.1 hypothetical protein BDZ99DRAFT_259398 [Mytilinidion resinicola]
MYAVKTHGSKSRRQTLDIHSATEPNAEGGHPQSKHPSKRTPTARITVVGQKRHQITSRSHGSKSRRPALDIHSAIELNVRGRPQSQSPQYVKRNIKQHHTSTIPNYTVKNFSLLSRRLHRTEAPQLRQHSPKTYSAAGRCTSQFFCSSNAHFHFSLTHSHANSSHSSTLSRPSWHIFPASAAAFRHAPEQFATSLRLLLPRSW